MKNCHIILCLKYVPFLFNSIAAIETTFKQKNIKYNFLKNIFLNKSLEPKMNFILICL